MTPEQTMQAHLELRGKRMIPMHWGAFVLAFHRWTDPVERVLAAAKKEHATIITPKIGQTVHFTATTYPSDPWWESYS
jgi:L-ascorbate metabolism protein UlaG (beta-lactamase superfamily)